jgi:hypothetical protein
MDYVVVVVWRAFTLGDYYSCVDYTVHGGQSISSSPLPIKYIGGIFIIPEQTSANSSTQIVFMSVSASHVRMEICPDNTMAFHLVESEWLLQNEISSAMAESEKAVSRDKKHVTSTPETNFNPYLHPVAVKKQIRK